MLSDNRYLRFRGAIERALEHKGIRRQKYKASANKDKLINALSEVLANQDPKLQQELKEKLLDEEGPNDLFITIAYRLARNVRRRKGADVNTNCE